MMEGVEARGRRHVRELAIGFRGRAALRGPSGTAYTRKESRVRGGTSTWRPPPWMRSGPARADRSAGRFDASFRRRALESGTILRWPERRMPVATAPLRPMGGHAWKRRRGRFRKKAPHVVYRSQARIFRAVGGV